MKHNKDSILVHYSPYYEGWVCYYREKLYLVLRLIGATKQAFNQINVTVRKTVS